MLHQSSVKCSICKKLTSEPINPARRILVCESCFLEGIKDLGETPNGVGMKELEVIFTKKLNGLGRFIPSKPLA